MAELRLAIGVDTKQAIRETKNLGKAMDSLADDFEEAAKKGDVAVEDIIASMRELSKQAKIQGNKAGDNLSKGIKSGTDDAKQEIGQSGREAAASFSGGFDDVQDLVQESLANALAGFGPLGAAAGVALAATLGAVFASAIAADEKLTQAREKASALAAQVYEDGGPLPLTERIQDLTDLLIKETTANPFEKITEGIADWGTLLDDANIASKRLGRSTRSLFGPLAGSDLLDARKMLKEVNDELHELALQSELGLNAEFDDDIDALTRVRDAIQDNVSMLEIQTGITATLGRKTVSAADEMKTHLEDIATKVQALSGAWEGATTDAADYFDTTDAGVVEFDVDAYLEQAGRVAAARDQIFRLIVTVPDNIQAEAEQILATQGAEAAATYLDSYTKANAEKQGKMREAADLNSKTIADQMAYKTQALINANDPPKQPVVVDVHDEGYQAWKNAQAAGVTIPLRFSYDPNTVQNIIRLGRDRAAV